MAISWNAQAQVNVEPLRQQVTARKFGARINASVTTYAGNTQGVVFGGAALLGGRSKRNFGYLDLSGDYTRLSGVVSVAKWFVHLRHNFQINPDLWWEEYAQLESDRFRRVTLRELVGTGPRVRALHHPCSNCISAALTWSKIRYSTAPTRIRRPRDLRTLEQLCGGNVQPG
ncbi:MAG: DUF481 domain-containing protein [Pseudomonadota bacterium]